MNAEDKGEGQRRTLSDDNWKKIMKDSGLPPEARGSIELAIRSYRALADLDVVPPSEIKEILRRLRDQTSALLKGLEEVLRYDDVMVGSDDCTRAVANSARVSPSTVESRRREPT
jgi:hypothetical protein